MEPADSEGRYFTQKWYYRRMRRRFDPSAITIAFFAVVFLGISGPTATPHSDLAIAGNDNRIPAGVAAKSTLTLDLDAVSGVWYPDGPHKQGIPMQAFAERGRAPQIPGPLIRVAVGTDIRLRIHNTIAGTTLMMHDLVDLPARTDRPVSIPSGTERIVRIHTFAPGTFHYWASTTDRAMTDRYGIDSQLGGAIVVDPPGPVAADRIFVLTAWGNVRNAAGKIEQNYKIVAINGRSWPATERLSYAQGERVTWRVINASAVNHPMHLHGFAFDVTERGDGTSTAPTAEREVTELVRPGGTALLHWTAERPGTWLYHCHLVPHSIAHLPTDVLLAGKPSLAFEQVYRRPMTQAMDMSDDMGGMVLAVTVRPSALLAQPVEIKPARRIELIVRAKPSGAPVLGADSAMSAAGEPVVPALEYVVREDGRVRTTAGSDAPAIFLTRGVGVGIDVINELAEPTSVHWHGIELADSYYDGVAGMSDGYGRVAPLVAPGATFPVTFAPPRAGTFIYHAHADDYWQLLGGLAGALIVLEPGQTFDPASDHIVMLTTPRDIRKAVTTVNVNGRELAEPIAMVAGTPQKLRLINITGFLTDANVALEPLANGADPVPAWRIAARDGFPLPEPVLAPGPVSVSVGQTRDVEFTPVRAGRYALNIRSPRNGPGIFAAIPVEITAASPTVSLRK